ncbi:MAG: hypothetical protein QXK07_08055 [Desulfurococcaceae archaeon]
MIYKSYFDSLKWRTSMRVVLVTVGRVEKLPLRGLLRVGLSAGDVVVLVYPRSCGELEVKKVKKAVGGDQGVRWESRCWS